MARRYADMYLQQERIGAQTPSGASQNRPGALKAPVLNKFLRLSPALLSTRDAASGVLRDTWGKRGIPATMAPTLFSRPRRSRGNVVESCGGRHPRPHPEQITI